jgi:putative ABC transport system ATP-binding protein
METDSGVMSSGKTSCFTFERVSFGWPEGRTILRQASFALPEGVFALVHGPSGAGKSTLLRLMNRLEEPQAGTIYYRGRALADCDPSWLRRQVAYLQQTPVVLNVTVRETLLMPFTYTVNKRLALLSDDDLAARLDEVLLGTVGLDERAATLSVGQRQRLCLVRALVAGPDVLLLDEPTASLDRQSQAVVEKMAQQLCAGGVTVVMVTHGEFAPRGVPIARIRIHDAKVDVCL